MKLPYLVRKVLQLILTLFAVVTFNFLLFRVLPGDPIQLYARSGHLTPECFKRLVNEVKAETGTKGKELFHPIRIMIIGSHSGPEFDKLIPIIEEGSRLNLPKHVLSVRERVEEFGNGRAQSA